MKDVVLLVCQGRTELNLPQSVAIAEKLKWTGHAFHEKAPIKNHSVYRSLFDGVLERAEGRPELIASLRVQDDVAAVAKATIDPRLQPTCANQVLRDYDLP